MSSTINMNSNPTVPNIDTLLRAEIDGIEQSDYEFDHFLKDFDRFNPESKSMYTKDSSGRITLTPLGKGICLNDAKRTYARYTYFALKDVFDPVVLCATPVVISPMLDGQYFEMHCVCTRI